MGPVVIHSLWTRPLLIPFYFALASVVVLILQAAFSTEPFKQLRPRVFSAAVDEEDEDEGVGSNDSGNQTGLIEAVKDHVERSGGSAIFLFQLLRLVLVLALLCLSIFNFLRDEEVQQHSVIDLWRKKKNKHKRGGELSEREWLDLAFFLNYVRVPFAESLTRVMNIEAVLVNCNFDLVLRLLFGVGRALGPKNPRFGRVVPSLLTLVYHLLRLRVPRYLATSYFHARACRWPGRRPTLDQNWRCCCRGRHPFD